MGRDKIFSQSLEKLQAFAFDEKVTAVFDDMIRRSVPIYARILQLLPLFMEDYLKKNATAFSGDTGRKLVIYDLGASLGAASLALAEYLDKFEPDIQAEFYLIDNSPAMHEKSKQLLPKDYKNIKFNFILQDIEQTPIKDADLVLLNFTLQFFAPNKRLDLLQKIYAGLNAKGNLILSEKIHFSDEQEQDFLQNMAWRFKAFNGYSELEISQKRQALENVLITDSLAEHKQRLGEAGFTNSYLWLQEFNFISLLANK